VSVVWAVTKYSCTNMQQDSETVENLMCPRSRNWTTTDSNSAFISYFPMHSTCHFSSHAPRIISSITLNEECKLWAPPCVNFFIFLLFSFPFEADISLQHSNNWSQKEFASVHDPNACKLSTGSAFHCCMFLNVPILFPLYVTDDVINDVSHFNIDSVAQ
jgi:hypothetical protein